MLELIIKTISDKKGEDILAIDVSKSSPICDYFVVCSASNERQMVSLANAIDEELGKNSYDIKKIDGKGSKWIVVDAKSIIVHIFSKEEREAYNLEKLWEPFPKVDITEYLK
jgi:ribosome-associated protein